MVEGARLESVYTGNCIKGSNPLVSAGFIFIYKEQSSQVNRECFKTFYGIKTIIHANRPKFLLR